jgi:hypothetical protein
MIRRRKGFLPGVIAGQGIPLVHATQQFSVHAAYSEFGPRIATPLSASSFNPPITMRIAHRTQCVLCKMWGMGRERELFRESTPAAGIPFCHYYYCLIFTPRHPPAEWIAFTRTLDHKSFYRNHDGRTSIYITK